MGLVFYPHLEEAYRGTLQERLDLFMDAAEQYKAIMLDATETPQSGARAPRDLKAAYNWEEIAILLHEVRTLPENNPEVKKYKAALLKKLAEIYEVLRCAKMPKLENVVLTLRNEIRDLISS